jgi:hypothetical protein
MFYADTLGAAHVLKRIGLYAATLGARYWRPAGLLDELARSGGAFAAAAPGRRPTRPSDDRPARA